MQAVELQEYSEKLKSEDVLIYLYFVHANTDYFNYRFNTESKKLLLPTQLYEIATFADIAIDYACYFFNYKIIYDYR